MIVAAFGLLTLLGPLLLSEQIGQLADAALIEARAKPVAVAAVIISALALDVFLPVPNGVTNTAAGAIFGFSLGFVVIWIGLMAASLLGYAAGALAARPLARRLLGAAELARAHQFAASLGPLVLIMSRPVPIFAELATLAAGMAGMRLSLFLLLTGCANLGVALIFAGIGAAAMASQSGALAFAGSILLPMLAWLGYRGWHGRR
jgi:membrane protein DedA with SNARE-associated domain